MKNIHIPVLVAGLALTALPVVAQQADTMGDAMMPPGLGSPMMNPANGRALFASKGCVVCHAINGVGGTDAPALDAETMDTAMHPFEFAARMWRGAPAMIAMQEDELGGQIELTGQELADIIGFAHDPAEQAKFSQADIPENIDELMHED